MLNFRELTLADKPSFDRILTQMQPNLSDYTFTNFYMWRHTYGLSVHHDETLDYWFIMARPAKWKTFFFAPLGDWNDKDKLRKALTLLDDHCETHGVHLFFRRVSESFMKEAFAVIPELRFREDRNTFDYLYQTSDLIELPGRKFHGKRNHLNQFLRSYAWQYQPIDAAVVSECLALKTEWFDLHLLEKDGKVSGENQAMIEVMEYFSDLKLVGAVLRVDDKIQALTIGEKLNPDTAVIHIEKANTEFKGIYAAMNQQFVVNQWADTLFINREEDMGVEGLRKAKTSYNPAELVKKVNLYK